MNKKVSTLLTMGLFVGGSLINVVNAEELQSFIKEKSEGVLQDHAAKLENGKSYFLGINGVYLHSSLDNKKLTYTFVDGTEDIKKEDLNGYLWTVIEAEQASGKMGYKFQNAETGEEIYFVKNGADWSVSDDPEQKKTTTSQNIFYWENDNEYGDQGGEFTPAKLGAAEQTLIPYFAVSGKDLVPVTEGKASEGEVVTAPNVTMYDLAEGISVDEKDLNELYNSTGFNFNLNDDKLSGVGNIFGDKKVVAIKVDGSDVIPGTTTSAIKVAEGEYFPNGTYFATYAPVNNNLAPTAPELLNCTFIAVDADNNISGDADEQKAGIGFTLTEVSGRDLVIEFDEDGNNTSAGNQNSVYNACFTVQESTTNDVYSLSLEKVRYVEASSAAKQVEKSLGISASKGSSEIATVTTTTNFAFKFAASTVVKPISLLKTDGAAIFNIQFYQQNGNDESVNGKYLTYDVQANELIAKGKVLADLNTPAYQWVISAVNGNNVTFTNRETNESFETQLFEEGDNLYSLAPSDDSDYNSYYYYNVDKKGDVNMFTSTSVPTGEFNLKNKLIRLLPVEEVNNYAGYLNVDDLSIMTLSFGRDIAPTSNKLYPIVDEDYNFEATKDLTDDVAVAAQWRLHKYPSAQALKRNYVYANGELINTKTQGDVVYAYVYALELVVDGKARSEYLNINGNTTSSTDVDPKDPSKLGNLYYYIQENVDGSVLIKNTRKADEALFLNDYNVYPNGKIQDIDDLKDNSFKVNSIYAASKADDVKTYLIAEAPAISLPANEGHYSFVSDLGNYITMNEERDGLTVKEESEPLYLYVTDKDAVVPSFYITKSAGANTNERMFMFNPTDSVNYYVAEGAYDKNYQLAETGHPTKVIFKAAAINETRDTLTTSIKGETTLVAMDANNTEKVEGGLDKFKVQIVENPDADGMYVIRQLTDEGLVYVYALNGKLAWTPSKLSAMNFEITPAEAPTANEGVSATEVKVIAYDGAINIKNAAGKNVVISTILGQIVANEVLTSDNATISVPAGIAIVSVDGEEAVKVSVR